MTDSRPLAETWSPPPTLEDHLTEGRTVREAHPRESLAVLPEGERDPMGILDRQDSTRVPELVPIRTQRMSESAFAFYRGTAALMAADLARSPSSGSARRESKAVMSAPAQNTPSAPVMMTARTASSSRSCTSCARRPSNTARFKLFFARGRLMIKVTMAPSRLTSTSLASLMVASFMPGAR